MNMVKIDGWFVDISDVASTAKPCDMAELLKDYSSRSDPREVAKFLAAWSSSDQAQTIRFLRNLLLSYAETPDDLIDDNTERERHFCQRVEQFWQAGML